MRLVKLGDYIEQIDVRNEQNKYSNVMGISVNKSLILTKADLANVNLKSYKILEKGNFAYCLVTSRNGNKISIVFNDEEDCIISSINPVFKIKDENKLNPYYLMMFFKRAEFDRYSRFNSWGSARETFSWEDLCDVKFPLPDIEIQNKYVAIYKALYKNLKIYETDLDDLRLVCEGYIEKLRRNYACEKLKKYLKQIDQKNVDNKIKLFKGVNVEHVFIDPKRVADDTESGKIVKNNQFAFNKVMKSNNTKLPIALRKGETCVVSGSYQVFEIKDEDMLLPEYLMLWLDRSETQRYAGFISFGTTRDIFTFEDMGEISIPIPTIETQKNIVAIYNSYKVRKAIAEKLREQISNICPILIAGAVKEGASENE